MSSPPPHSQEPPIFASRADAIDRATKAYEDLKTLTAGLPDSHYKELDQFSNATETLLHQLERSQTNPKLTEALQRVLSQCSRMLQKTSTLWKRDLARAGEESNVLYNFVRAYQSNQLRSAFPGTTPPFRGRGRGTFDGPIRQHQEGFRGRGRPFSRGGRFRPYDEHHSSNGSTFRKTNDRAGRSFGRNLSSDERDLPRDHSPSYTSSNSTSTTSNSMLNDTSLDHVLDDESHTFDDTHHSSVSQQQQQSYHSDDTLPIISVTNEMYQRSFSDDEEDDDDDREQHPRRKPVFQHSTNSPSS